ncbi:uncharacterized protein LOC118414279 [Branchiostoma floridae]|uniref:Uncharacterized protein LOC118414279 n=1 Tax=Branchiostoma floridae TaxID=7739 RepID=A0A9J7L2U6_BRAFL|nr:uncharacterized protein LOC118414279 [Branchiostoma floridae]
MADVTWYMSESAEAVAEELSRLLLSLESLGDDEDVAEQYLNKFREIVDAHLPEGPVVGMEEGIAVVQAAVEKFVQARQNFSEGLACMQWLASSLATLCAQYVVDLNYQHLPVETKVKFVATVSMANELLQPYGHEDFLEVLLAARQPWPPVFLRILQGKASDMSEVDVHLSREPSLLMEYRVRSLQAHGAMDDASTLAQYCMNHPSHRDVLVFREMFLLCQWQAGKVDNIKRQVQFIESTKLYFIVEHFEAEGMLELAATVSTSYLIHQWKKGEYCCNKELVRQWCHIQHPVEGPTTTILDSARTLAFKNDPKVLHLLYFAEALHKEVGKDSMPLVADLLLRAVEMDKPVTDPFFHPNAAEDKTGYHHSAPTILSYMAVLLEGDYEIRCASQLTSFSISPDLDQYYVVEAVVNLPEEVQGTGVNLSRHKRRDILKTLRKLRPRSCGLHPEMSWQQLKPHMLKLLTSEERNTLLQEHVEAECDISAFEEIGKSPCKATVSKPRLTEKEPVCAAVESDEEDLTLLLSDSDDGSCGPVSPIFSGARYGLDFATPPRPPKATSIVDNVANDSPFVGEEEVIVCENEGRSPAYGDKWKQAESMEESRSVSQEGWLEPVANDAVRSTPDSTETVSMDKMVDTDDLLARIIKDKVEEVASNRNSSVLSNGHDEDKHQKRSSTQGEHSKEHPAGQGVRKPHKNLRHVTLHDLLWKTNPEDFDFTTSTEEEAVNEVSVSPADASCGDCQQPVDKEEQSMDLECTETLDLDAVESVPCDVVGLDRMEELHSKYGGTLGEWGGFVPPEPLKIYTHSSDQSEEIVSCHSPEKGNHQGDLSDFTLTGDLMAENGNADLLKIKMADFVDSMDQGGPCGSVLLVDLENCSAPDNTIAAAEMRMAAHLGHQKSADTSAEAGGATGGSNQNMVTSRKNIFEAISTVTNATERQDRGPFISPSSKGEKDGSKAKRRPSKLSSQQGLQRDAGVPNRSRLHDSDSMHTVAPVHSLDPTWKNTWNSSASSLSSRGDTTSSHEGYDGSSEYSTETGEGMESGLHPIQGPSRPEKMQSDRNFWTGFDFRQNNVTHGVDGMDEIVSKTKEKSMLEPAELKNRSLDSRDKKSAPTAKPLQFNKLRQMLSEGKASQARPYNDQSGTMTGQGTYSDQRGTVRLSKEHTDKVLGTQKRGNSPYLSERTIGVNTDDACNTDLEYMMRHGELYSSGLADLDRRDSASATDSTFVEKAKGTQENVMRGELLHIPRPFLATKKRRKGMIGVGPTAIQKRESYKCGCCTFQTIYVGNIKRHMNRHGDHIKRYSKDISFVCQYCEYSSSTRMEVITHMTSSHQHNFPNSSLDPWTTDLPFGHAAAATLATKDIFDGKEQISYDHQSFASSREDFVPMSGINDAKVNGSKSKIGTKKRKGKCPQNLAEIRKKTCAELAAKGIPHLQDIDSLKDSGIQGKEDPERKTEERYWQADNPSLMMPMPSRNDGVTSTDRILTLRPTKQLPQTSFDNFVSPSNEEHLTLLLQPVKDTMLAVPTTVPEASHPKFDTNASTNEMPIFSHHSFSPPVRMSPMVSPPVMLMASPPTTLSPTENTSPPKKSSHVSPSRNKDENQNFASPTVKSASKRKGKKDYKASFLYNLLTDKDEMKDVARSPGADPSMQSRCNESLSVVTPLFPQEVEIPMIQGLSPAPMSMSSAPLNVSPASGNMSPAILNMSPAYMLPQTAFAANIPNSHNFATFSPFQTGLQSTVGCYNVGSLPLVDTAQGFRRDEGLFVPADKKKRSRKGKSSNSRKQSTSAVNAGASPTVLNIPPQAKYSPRRHVPDSSIPTFRPSPSQSKPGSRRWINDQHSRYMSGLTDVTPYGEPDETLWQSQADWWHSPQHGQNPAHARSKPAQTSPAAWPKTHTVTTNEVQPLDLRTTPTFRSSFSANHMWASHYAVADNSSACSSLRQSQREPVDNNGKVSSPMRMDQISSSLHAQSQGCPPPTENVQIQDSEGEGQVLARRPLTVPYIPAYEHCTASNDIAVNGCSISTVAKGSSSYESDQPTSMAATTKKARGKSAASSAEQNENTRMTSGDAVEVWKADSVDRQESNRLTLAQLAASPNEARGIDRNITGNEMVAWDSGTSETAAGHVDDGPKDDTDEENVGELDTGKAPDIEPSHIHLHSESESSALVATSKEPEDSLFVNKDNFFDDDIPVADSTITAHSCLTTEESVDTNRTASEVEPAQSPLTNDKPSDDDVIPLSEVQLTQGHISSGGSVPAEERKTATGTVVVHGSLTNDKDPPIVYAEVETGQTCKSEPEPTSKDEALQTCKVEPKQTCSVEPVKTCNIEPEHACNSATRTVDTIDEPVGNSSIDGKDAVIANNRTVDVFKGKQSTSLEGNRCSASLPQSKTLADRKLTIPEQIPKTKDDKPSFHYADREQADNTGYRGPVTRKRMSTDTAQANDNSSDQRKKFKISLQKSLSAGRKKRASPTVSNITTETASFSSDALKIKNEASEEGLTSQQREESVQPAGLDPCTSVKASKDSKGAELMEGDVLHDPCVTPQKKEKTCKDSLKRSSVCEIQKAEMPSSKEELNAVDELVTEASEEAASLQRLEDSSPTKTSVSSEPCESKGDLQSLEVFSQNIPVPKENAKRSQKMGRFRGRRGRAQRSYQQETTAAHTDNESGRYASEEDSTTCKVSVDRKGEDSKREISSSLGNGLRKSSSLKSRTKPLSHCTDEAATSESSKSQGSLQKSPSSKKGRKKQAVKSQQKLNPGSAELFANQMSEDAALELQDKSLEGSHNKEKVPLVRGRTVRRRVATQRMTQYLLSSAEEDSGAEVPGSDQFVQKPSSTTQVKSQVTKQTVKRQQKRKSTGGRTVSDSKGSSLETISAVGHEHGSKDSQEPTSSEPLAGSACCNEVSNLTGSQEAETAVLASSPGTDPTPSEVITLEGRKSQKKNRSNCLVIQKSEKAAEATRRSVRKRVPTCKILGKTVAVFSKHKSHISKGRSKEESDQDSLVLFNPQNTGWTYSREDKKRYQEKSALPEEKGTETIDPPSTESVELEMPIKKEENMNPVEDNIPVKCAPHTKPNKTPVMEKDTTGRRLRSRSPTSVSVTIATGETRENIIDPSVMEEAAAGPSNLTSGKAMATRQRRNRSEEDLSKVLLPENSTLMVESTKRKKSNKTVKGSASPTDGSLRKAAGTAVNSASGRTAVKSSKSKHYCVPIPASGKKSTFGNIKSSKKPTPCSASRSTGVKTKVMRKGKPEATPRRKKSAGTGEPPRLLVTKGKVSPKGNRSKKK